MTGARGRSALVAAPVRGPPAPRRVGRLDRRAEGPAQHALRPARARRLRALCGQARARRCAAVAALFAASLLAKPMLVTLPFLLLLLDAWPLGRALAGSGRRGGRRSRAGRWAPRAPWRRPRCSLLSIASAAITVVAQSRWGAVAGRRSVGVGARRERASRVRRATSKMVWPAARHLLPVPRRAPPGGSAAARCSSPSRPPAAILARAPPLAAVGWCWFVGTLVPVIGLVQVGGQALADRYTYFPSIGLFLSSRGRACARVALDCLCPWRPARRDRDVGLLAVVAWRQLGGGRTTRPFPSRHRRDRPQSARPGGARGMACDEREGDRAACPRPRRRSG